MPIDNNIMDWNDTLESDGQEFIVLPEGDYAFTVTGFERGHFPGSAKIPPCNKATLTVRIDNDLGAATARFDLILYRTIRNRIERLNGEFVLRNGLIQEAEFAN